MLTNPKPEIKKYKCNKRIMEYLVYQCGLPILSFDETHYYFTDNLELRMCLSKMPVPLKLLTKFMK